LCVFRAPLHTRVNTQSRINFRGGLGDKLNRPLCLKVRTFADYFNRYAESIRPAGESAINIIAKDFKTDSYDFPLAEANLTFSASKHIDLQLGKEFYWRWIPFIDGK
jgi:hypothetical protein